MSFSVEGTLYKVDDTMQFASGFQKRDFIVKTEDNPEYPQYLKFELIKDKVDLIGDFAIGAPIKVHFNLRGREHTKKDTGEIIYINSLHAWKLEQAQGTGQQPPQQQAAQPGVQPASPASQQQAQPQQSQQAAAPPQQESEDDGLPF
jgi:hypothetical protein